MATQKKLIGEGLKILLKEKSMKRTDIQTNGYCSRKNVLNNSSDQNGG